MKRFINHIFLSACCLAGAITLGSCDTDVETADINEPDISRQNSQLYEQYLTNLRDYKVAPHKTVVAYFDNSVKQPFSQGQIMTAAPDSIDYLVLTSPVNTTEAEMEQMAELRAKKGTKVLYSINFKSVRATTMSCSRTLRPIPTMPTRHSSRSTTSSLTASARPSLIARSTTTTAS